MLGYLLLPILVPFCFVSRQEVSFEKFIIMHFLNSSVFHLFSNHVTKAYGNDSYKTSSMCMLLADKCGVCKGIWSL